MVQTWKNVKIRSERWEQLEADARLNHRSVPAHLDVLLEQALGYVIEVISVSNKQTVPAAKLTNQKRDRTTLCPHRVPPSAYCKVCDG
jgi:hypothetical protein